MQTLNPLSPEEKERLWQHIVKGQEGHLYTEAEVRDYLDLIKKLETAKPYDPGVLVLTGIGAFLSGLYRIPY